MSEILHLSLKKVFILSIILFIYISPCSINAQDWPYWRGPNRNGMTDNKDWSYEAFNQGPRILWQTDVGHGYSSVSVNGDYLYTMGNTNKINKVLCLNTKTGNEVWNFEFKSTERVHFGSLSTPVYENNCVYIMGRNGKIFSLDSKIMLYLAIAIYVIQFLSFA